MHHSCLPAALAALAAIVPETFATAPDGGLLGCRALVSAGMGQNVQFPSTPGGGYRSSLNSYYSLDVREVEPSCVFKPRSAHDVSQAIKIISNLPSGNVAVRGGGHTVWPNNNIANGITIDMSLLGHTKLHQSKESDTAVIASVGAGARWEVVLLEVEKRGLSVAAGRVSTVGVAGLTLGGGLSFHSGRHGFTCDNVVNYEVVLADGQIVNANATQNLDLFKALKGGGSNFGIVTRFDFATFPAGLLYGGIMMATWDHKQTVLDSLIRLIEINEQHPADNQIVLFTYNATADFMTVGSINVNVDGATDSTSFEPMASVPWLYDTRTTQTYAEMVVDLSDPGGERSPWFSLCFQNNKLVANKAAELFEKLVAECRGIADLHRIQVVLQQLPKHYAQKNPGGNVLGMDNSLTEDAILWQGQGYAQARETEGLLREKLATLTAELEAYAKSVGAATQWRYINYVDPTQDPLKSYGPENIAFMKGVAAKFDPHGFFQTRVPGGFKISHVD
ncbi:FAD binding domain-containing protein [Apiospora kogelbergensis]|uniref:FAD binding domain-containing protein n=1 Tax=Apiospora kogelbergensis TaxID=1337665 RepID=UPI00312D9C86